MYFSFFYSFPNELFIMCQLLSLALYQNYRHDSDPVFKQAYNFCTHRQANIEILHGKLYLLFYNSIPYEHMNTRWDCAQAKCNQPEDWRCTCLYSLHQLLDIGYENRGWMNTRALFLTTLSTLSFPNFLSISQVRTSGSKLAHHHWVEFLVKKKKSITREA